MPEKSNNGSSSSPLPTGGEGQGEGKNLAAYRALISLDSKFAQRGTPLPLETLVTRLESEPGALKFEAPLRERLKALLTVRPAVPFPEDVLAGIDALLAAEKRTTTATTQLWQGDITTLAVDAIVNAANAQMLGCFRPFHPCIDNAIQSAAGPRVREDCARIMKLQGHDEPTGTAKVTRAYHLPSRFIFHTVGPIIRGPLTEQDKSLLADCYRACLDLTLELPDVRSIAFCAISTGVFGFPRAPAARIAIDTVAKWKSEHASDLRVIFNVFSDDDRRIYEEAFAA